MDIVDYYIDFIEFNLSIYTYCIYCIHAELNSESRNTIYIYIYIYTIVYIQ